MNPCATPPIHVNVWLASCQPALTALPGFLTGFLACPFKLETTSSIHCATPYRASYSWYNKKMQHNRPDWAGGFQNMPPPAPAPPGMPAIQTVPIDVHAFVRTRDAVCSYSLELSQTPRSRDKHRIAINTCKQSDIARPAH